LPVRAASCAFTLSSSAWYSSVATAPNTRLASAVSCTPGSSTTMRDSPCCWINGSDTPSSLTRLRSVVTFWVIAVWASFCTTSDLIVAVNE